MKGILENLQEHWREVKRTPHIPLHIHDHCSITGNTTTVDNFNIVEKGNHNITRNIKESLYIRVSSPSLNNRIGRVPHI